MSLLTNRSKKKTLEKQEDKIYSSTCKRNRSGLREPCRCQRCIEEDEQIEIINDLEDNILELKEKIHQLETENLLLKENQSSVNKEEIKKIYEQIERMDLTKNFIICQKIKENLTKLSQNFVYSQNDLLVEKNLLEEQLKIKNEEILALKKELSRINELEEIIKAQKIKEKILKNEILDLKGSIRVFCRIRPPMNQLSFKVKNDFEKIEVTDEQKNHSFQFDRIFSQFDNQNEIFNEVGPIISNGLEGYKICIFAYG